MCSANFVNRAEKSNFPRSILIGVVWLFFALSSVWAIDPGRLISQYGHTAWRTKDGAFDGFPIVITQTTDGYLWIGTNVGLIRFDGVRFTTWKPPAGKRLLDSRIFSLLGTHDGSLWIGTGYSISRWKDSELTSYPELSGRIESIVEDDAGAVWLVRTQATDQAGPLCRVKDQAFQCYGGRDGIAFNSAIQLSKDSGGGLWIGGYEELCRWKPGSCTSYFADPARRPETFASLRRITAGANGAVWAVIDQSRPVLQLEEFAEGKWIKRAFPEIPSKNSDVTALFVDRDESLWLGTSNHGVFRIRGKNVDHFGNTDGLSSDAVGRIFQDGEGTVWIATAEGIDNFRDLKVTSYSPREGLSAAAASTVLASANGTVWIGNYRALDFMRDGKLSAIRAAQGLPGLNVTTMFEDHAGRLWVGVDSGLWMYEGGKFRAISHADGSGLGVVYAITEDVQHDIWVRAGPHLDRIHDLKLQDEITSPQIATAFILATNPRGGIFLGLVDGDLVRYQDGKTQTAPSNEVGNRRQIRDLLVEADGSVWGTTLDELVRWKDGVRKNLTTRNGLPCDGIFALVKDGRGSLWLDSQCGLIAIDRAQLDNWWEQPDRTVEFKLLNALDGVQPGLTSLKPQAARSPDGRLWFVNTQILQVLDPDHLRRNTIAPPVEVEEVVADRKSYAIQSYAPQKNLRLPALTRDLEIEYTGLSYVAPQKVRFRYMLEGRDKAWQDPGTRRQAFYSDLPPGHYRFRVIACNNDGVWNEAGATLDFSVLPAWYQTIWFRVLCVVTVVVIAWAFYQLRVRQIARVIAARFDERLAERTRMARDLHDTFLQTIQGSKLVADDALEANGDPARMRRAIEQLSVWLDQAMQEGRAALNSLRTSTTQTNDLAEAFRRATENGQRPDFMVSELSVVGEARDMHPIVRDEVYRIGFEAIRNAHLHSQASRVDVELRYAQDLTVCVRDNGVGIEPRFKERGKDGHFGLRGMRERAARIGADLTITTSADSGTEITVIVPGRIVFRKRSAQSPKHNGRA
jgi:signal transduction histidine kinase/ligand-binding sensor domain-containing protein